MGSSLSSPEVQFAEALRRHNLRVLTATAISLAAVIVAWPLLFGLAYWLWLLGLSSALGAEARMPAHFWKWSLWVAAGLLGFAWFLKWRNPAPRIKDRKNGFEIFLDFLLMVPRMTLAVPENLKACFWLDRDEIYAAVQLVERVAAKERMPLHALPVEIPQERTRSRVVGALLQMEVLEMGTKDGGYLRLVHRRKEPASNGPPLERTRPPLRDARKRLR